MNDAIHDDELLEALAEVARGERAVELEDARWDALAADELSAEDRAALETWGDEDELAALAFEAFRPVDEGRKAAFVDAMLAELGSTATDATPDVQSAQPEPVRTTGAKIIPFRRSFLGRGLLIGAPLALAAALAVFLLRPGAAVPVPGYSLEVTGGLHTVRGDEVPKGPPTVGPGVRLELVLSPDTRVTGPVAARGFLVRDGEARPWALTPEITEAGAIRLAGDAAALGLTDVPAGHWTAIIAVGRPDALPKTAPIADPADDAGWRRLVTPLELRK
jgi:hypothetical protein